MSKEKRKARRKKNNTHSHKQDNTIKAKSHKGYIQKRSQKNEVRLKTHHSSMSDKSKISLNSAEAALDGF
jgi:hypothetical protein